ncbi:CHAD domain-containing protein [Stenotrophomonas rhizophila]|uniref:CHAD domain-containing protein n=1 Tax=Stenotrophomonas rhizophila TaxID=216778 RepID=UPI0011A2A196|nr:CHAD domain-containing protein [Stenotrophomonas rhizophila]
MSADAPGLAARDLLVKDARAILDALPAANDQNEAIHVARKAIRRMRAVLGLLTYDTFGVEREDRALRQLGKGLSGMRDAHVVVETANRLQAAHPELGWAPIIEALELRRTRILQRSLAVDPGFLRRRRVVEQVLQRLEVQPWRSLRRRSVRTALDASERRAAKAGKRAARADDPEAVHRWRRRVRRLRMQLDAAQVLDALQGHGDAHGAVVRKGKELHRISDRLGWSQDVRLLRNLVRNMPWSEGKGRVMGLVEEQLAQAGDEVR